VPITALDPRTALVVIDLQAGSVGVDMAPHTAAGLLRTFGYVGSIASSAITGIVFHHRVSDHGVHLIAWIMIGISLGLTALTLADRTLRSRPDQPAGT
jgi:sugar phosphate permease